MNSRSKPAGTRKTTTRGRKPATIDLEAKEVKSDADAATSKPETSAETSRSTASASSTDSAAKTKEPEKPLGRAGAKPAETSANKEAKAATDPKPADPAKPAPVSKPEKSRSGGGLMGGIVGAVAAVAGLGAIGQVENAKDIPLIGALYSDSTGSTSNAEIEALRSEIAQLKLAPAEINLDEVNARIAALENSTPSAGNDEIQNRLNSVETGLSDLSDSLTRLADAAQNSETGGDNEFAAALATATERLSKIEQQVSDLASQTAPDLSPVESKIAELSEAISQNAASLASIQEQSSELQATVSSVKASEKVAMSVAVNALGAALENDDPVNLAIASIESLGGKSAETDRLSELAAEGIPTRSSLLAKLESIIDTAQNPVTDSGTGTISERFWANARNLVSFRSSGPQEGDSPVAVLSRIKAHVEAGDLQSVGPEWEKLPPEIRQSGEAWLADMNKRIEAYGLYEMLSAKLTAQAG